MINVVNEDCTGTYDLRNIKLNVSHKKGYFLFLLFVVFYLFIFF